MTTSIELEKLVGHVRSGTLSQDEFLLAKAALLGAGPTQVIKASKATQEIPTRLGCAVIVAPIVLIGLIFLGPWLGLGGGGPRGPMEALGGWMRPTQVLADDDWLIDAGGRRWLEVTLAGERPVLLEVRGKGHMRGGFTVYLLNPVQLALFKTGRPFSYDETLHAANVWSFRREGKLPAGTSAIVIIDGHNPLGPTAVHMRLVIDP